MNLQTEQDVKDWIAESDKNINPYTLPEMAFKAGANLILNNLHELPQVKELLSDFSEWFTADLPGNTTAHLIESFLSQYKTTEK